MTNEKTTAAGTPPPAPVRRVGCVTLGLCLIALGLCFLCYYWLPGFDFLPVVKIGGPLALAALGAEVLYCAARPGPWKYDFLAVFGCLAIMGGAFCLSLLPLFWQAYGPESRTQLDALGEEYGRELYADLRGGAGPLRLEDLDVYIESRHHSAAAPASLDGLAGRADLYLTVGLYGPYETAQDFARDCARVVAAVRGQDAQPRRVELEWESADGESGFDLTLSGEVQLDWSEEEMAEHVRGSALRSGDARSGD